MFKNNIIRIILFSFIVGSNFNPTPQISFDEYTPINIHSYGLGLEDIISIKNYNADFPDVKFYLEGNQLYLKSVMNQSFFSMIEIEARDREIIIPVISHEKSKVQFYIDKDAQKSINIMGTFNEWNVEKDSMHFNGYVWEYDKYLKDGIHEYKFVMDGYQYFLDPFSLDSIADGSGEFNSLITIESNKNSSGDLYKKSEVHFNKNILLEFDYIQQHSNDKIDSDNIYVIFNNQLLNPSQIRSTGNNITVALDENNRTGLLSIFSKNLDNLLIKPNYTIIDEHSILDSKTHPKGESMLDIYSAISDNKLARVEKRLIENLNLSPNEILKHSALSLGDIIMLYNADNISVWIQKYFNETILIAFNNSKYNQSIQFDYMFNDKEGELVFSKEEDRLFDSIQETHIEFLESYIKNFDSLEVLIKLPYRDNPPYNDSTLVILDTEDFLTRIDNDEIIITDSNIIELGSELTPDSLTYNDSILTVDNYKIYLELKPYKTLVYNMK